MGSSIKSVVKLVTAPIKALYDPVGAFKDVFGGVQGIFAGLTGAAKVSGAGSSEPSSQTVRSSKAPVRFILGRASTGGVLAWVQEQPGDQTSGEWLHIVYVLSEGAIAGVDQIYVDERPLSELGENATSEVIIDPTQVNAFLLANCPDWRQEQIGRGLSFVRLSFKYDAEKFPSGIPDVRFVVRGRRDIYDPRNGSSGYSANTALLILWYLRNRCGIPDDEIIFQSFASAANVSDEAVGGPDGTVTPRYFAGAVIGADEKRNTVLDNLLSACAGTLIRVGGRWSLQVGAYYGPADFTINEDMVIGTVEGTTEVSNSDAINTMRGTFVDPAQAWAETDYPEVAIQDWITADGGELAESQSFAYVTDAYLAQRLANISLRRRRSGGSVSMPLNFNGYNCRPGRAIKVDLPSLNILGEFMVTEWTMGAADACKVTLKPYEQAIFDDAVGQPYDPLGFINLPVGGLAAVTGLAWTPSSVAEIIQGVLSWGPPAQTVLSYTVTIRKGTEVVQSLKVGGEAVSCNINGLASGTYAMSVVAFGPGTRSGEASINVNVGGPPVPESCDYFASVDSITLVPVNRQNSLNGGTYEYFHATNPQAPIADAVYLGQGLTFTHTGLAFAKQYFYYVRSANAYGKSDFLYVAAATSDDPTQMLEVIKGEILESHLGQQLTEKIDLIDGNGPGSVNERVESARSELSEQVAEVNNAVAAVSNSVTAVRDNLQQQVNAVGQEVGAAKADLQQKIDAVSVLAGSLPYNKDKTYTTNQGVLGADGKLYQAVKAVPKNTPPPNATYWTDVGQAIVTAAGTASRVSKVETDVSTLDGKTTAQATQIGGLQSSLTTTNQNVTTAQQAAQAAATAAGAKGEVIYGSTAPATDKRLAQNLWIDTSNNANTPKRWNGTTWVAVTDKAATDAAAAAQSALSQVALKADATVVNNVATRVSEAEGKLSSQATRMDGMQTSIDGKASSQSLQQVSNRVTATEQKDAAQDQQLTSQSQALTSLTDSVSKKAEASTVQALSNEVEQHGSDIAATGQAIVSINTALGELGGENLLYNSSFEKAQSGGMAEGWTFTGGAGTGRTPSLVPSALAPSELAQRLDMTGLSASAWVRVQPDAGRRPSVVPGQQLTFSVYMRGTPGLALRPEILFRNALGAVVGSTTGTTNVATELFQRFSVSMVAPEGAATVDVYPVCFGTSSINSGYMEMDRTQLEVGGSMSGWRDNGQVNAANNAATSTAVESLTSAVNQQGGTLSSVAGRTTTLENSLSTTNQNVSTAQQAADAANTLAGGKGKVIIQPAAPAAADRLAQNLWIDTTNNANTPKRWSGSAWVAVTDKAATDAAAAAANALSVAQGKADASVVQGINSRLTNAEGKLTSQSQAITALDNSLTVTNQNVTTAQQAAQAAADSAGGKGKVLYQSTSPAAADRLAQNLWIDTTNNANTPKRWSGSAWVAVTDKVATDAAAAAQSALTQVATKAEASAVQSLNNKVEQQGADITANGQALTRISTSLGELGGENLLYNPSFEKAQSGGMAEGWTFTGGAGTGRTPSLVPSALAPSELAQRLDMTGLSASAWVRIQPDAGKRPSVVSGQSFAFSIYVRGTPGLALRAEILFRNAQGAVVGSVVGASNVATEQYQRVSVIAVAPEGAATVDVYPVCFGTSSISSGYMEMDRAQLEVSASMSGWRDNGQVKASEITAVSSAVSGLSSTVSQQGSTLASVSNRTTALENSVSNASTGLATKASAASVSALANRVTATESGLTSTSSNVTDLQNTLGSMNGGVNLIPAEYCVFGSVPPAINKQPGLNASTVANAGAAGKYLLRLESTVAQVNYFYLASGSTDWTMKLKPGKKYILSFWVQADAARAMSLRIRYINAAGNNQEVELAQVNATTTLSRVSAVMTMPAALLENCSLVFYQSRTASASNHLYDGFMLEEQVGTNDAPSSFSVGSSAREAQATSRALSELSSEVTHQGTDLSAQAQQITGLSASVGSAQAAIQNEITARTNGDSALSQQLETTQASLGETTASVQRVSTTLNQLNGVANASEVVKVQITANGIRHAAGFGLSIDNSKGAVQSTFAILANRFAILNPSGDAVSSPFAVVGNQTFISDAYIRDASIGNAKITNGAITTAKIGEAEVDTLRIRGNAVTIPVGAFAGASTVSVTVTLDGNYAVFLQGSLTQVYFSDITMTRNGTLLWMERPRESTLASRGVMDYPGPGTHTYTLSSNHAGNTNGASILAVVCKR